MPELFLHGAFDHVCETINSPFALPMRANCCLLTETAVLFGHGMVQERPVEANSAPAGIQVYDTARTVARAPPTEPTAVIEDGKAG